MAQFMHPFLTPIGVRKDGRPIYPILGGSEPPTPPAPPAPTPTPPAPPAPDPSDKGFPDGTPLERMTVEQREAYWKYHARKHEDRVKAFGDLTPERLAELQEKARRAEALEHDLMSETERSVAEAAAQARLVAEAELMPELVTAYFRSELKGRVPDEQLDERLAAITEPLDLTKFFTEAGKVDTAKVAAFVANIAPATGTPSPTPPPRGPSPSGLGQRPGSSASASVASGRDIYRARHSRPQQPA
jgi:hypothetical protein